MRWILAAVLAVAILPATHPALATCVSTKCQDAQGIERAREMIQDTCGCTRAGQTHKKYKQCVQGAIKAANVTAIIPQKSCRKLIKKCENNSICGKPNAAVCCVVKKNTKVKGSIVASPAKCKKGTPCGADLGFYSTFDACAADGTCAGPITTTTTTSPPTTTTAPPTTTTTISISSTTTTSTTSSTTTTTVPTITTDAPTYAAGATVTYTGTAWNNCTNVKIDVFGPGGSTIATGITPDAAGAFTGTFPAPTSASEYLLNAQSPGGPPECNAFTTFAVMPTTTVSTITTDAPTYAAGATVTYTGTAWNNCTNVKVDLFGPGGSTIATGITPDAAGAFTGTFPAPTSASEYLLSAQSLGGPPCAAFTTFAVP
jgi:hypothetical protein